MFRQLRDRFGVDDSQYVVSGVLVVSLSVMSHFDYFLCTYVLFHVGEYL